jgi:hypothetical protein
MSVLYLRARPVVAFDVNNPEHRKYFAEFVKYNTWGKCPVRFMAESLDMDLVSYINNKMLKYYVRQEFDSAKHKIKIKKKPRSPGTSSVVSNKHTVPSPASRTKNTLPTPTKTSGAKL